MFVEIESSQNSGVIEGLQDLEFMQGGPADGFMSSFVFARHIVNANSASRFTGWMFGLEILISEKRVFFNQFF